MKGGDVDSAPSPMFDAKRNGTRRTTTVTHGGHRSVPMHALPVTVLTAMKEAEEVSVTSEVSVASAGMEASPVV